MNEVAFEKIAKEALQYISALNIQSITVVESNQLSSAERDHLNDDINSMRKRGKTYEDQINTKPDFLRLDVDEQLHQLEINLEGALETKKGNCSETSCLGLKFIQQHYPNVRVELFSIKGGDHVFLVQNRSPNSKENDPSTWGNAIIIDIHYGAYFPASEYKEKLKNFVSEINTKDNTTTTVLQNFDTNLHALAKEVYNGKAFDNDFLNSFNSEENLRALKNYFNIKLVFLKFMLTHLKEELEEINTPSILHKNIVDRVKTISLLLKEIEEIMKKAENDTQENYFLKKQMLRKNLRELFLKTQEVLSPFSKTYVFNKDTQKKIAILDFMFFKYKNKSISLTHITNEPDDVILYAKKILDNFIDEQTDKNLAEQIKENLIDIELNQHIENAIKESFIVNSRRNAI